MKRTPGELAIERAAVFQAIADAELAGIRRGDLCRATGLDEKRVAQALRWWCRQGLVCCYAYPRWSLTARGIDRAHRQKAVSQARVELARWEATK